MRAADRDLAGKAHDQQAEAVAVHQVFRELLVLGGNVLRFEEHGGQPNFGLSANQVFNVAENVLVFFAEALSDLTAGCNRLAVLGG